MSLLEDGAWTAPPRAVEEDGDGLLVECVGGSDFWRTTYYGFERDSGHALLGAYADGRSLEVTFVADLEHQYDQAGLVVRADDRHWLKAGLEVSDGVPQLGAVVTDGVSDWSCGAVPDRPVDGPPLRVRFTSVVLGEADIALHQTSEEDPL